MPAKIDDCVLMTDDGSENYGEVLTWVSESESPRIKHLVAQLDIEFSNSMVEAAHKQLKYRFLYNQKISDYKELSVFIALAIKDFNNRPHHVLGGLSPMEVLSGKRIDKSQESKLAVEAKQFIISQNQKMKCCEVG